MTDKTQEMSLDAGKKLSRDIATHFKNTLTLRSATHELLVRCAYYGITKNDYSHMTAFLNEAVKTKFLNSGALTLWVKEYAGLRFNFDKATQTFSSVGRRKDFTFDDSYVPTLKANPFYESSLIQHTEIKLNDTIDSVFKGAIDKLALNILAGKFTQKNVEEYVSGLVNKTVEATRSAKVQEKYSGYLSQIKESSAILA
jgi:hypothetical protein